MVGIELYRCPIVHGSELRLVLGARLDLLRHDANYQIPMTNYQTRGNFQLQ